MANIKKVIYFNCQHKTGHRYRVSLNELYSNDFEIFLGQENVKVASLFI